MAKTYMMENFSKSLRREIREIQVYCGDNTYLKYKREEKIFFGEGRVPVIKEWRGGDIHSREAIAIVIDSENESFAYYKKEYDKFVKIAIQKNVLDFRKSLKNKKEREAKERLQEIEALKNNFASWCEIHKGKQLTSKREDELLKFESEFTRLSISWTYVHEIDKKKFKISFSTFHGDEDGIDDRLSHILKELKVCDDGESDILSNEYTTLNIEVYEDGFEIKGETNDPELGSMKANRLNIEWL